jgi:opacity protein-like surface antigen
MFPVDRLTYCAEVRFTSNLMGSRAAQEQFNNHAPDRCGPKRRGAGMFGFWGLPYSSLRCAFAAGVALLFCLLPLVCRSAHAQTSFPCFTPKAEQRLTELQKRVANYEKYLADAQTELTEKKLAIESGSAPGGTHLAVRELETKIERFQQSLKKWNEEIGTLSVLPPCPTPADTSEPPRRRFGPYPTLAGGPSVPGIQGAGFSATPIFSNVDFIASVELGGGAGAASYDEARYDTSGYFGGASAGVRLYEASRSWFVGTQASLLGGHITGGTNIPGTTVDLVGTLVWMAPIDVQAGRTFQTAALPNPVTLYAFGGPTWGRKNLQIGFSPSENLTVFGWSGGFGIDIGLTPNWSVGAKLRGYSLGPTDLQSEGLHLHGVIGTASLSYHFNSRQF